MLRKETNAAHPLVPRPTAPVREVEMEVVFGTPSKNCSGAGVCLIANRSAHWHSIPCPHAPAIIHYLPGEELIMRFRKQHLGSDTVKAYFHGDQFLVEEAFQIPQRLVRLWNLQTEMIPAGRYPLEEYSLEWRLYFPLEE